MEPSPNGSVVTVEAQASQTIDLVPVDDPMAVLGLRMARLEAKVDAILQTMRNIEAHIVPTINALQAGGIKGLLFGKTGK